jgi:hypothetical protein
MYSSNLYCQGQHHSLFESKREWKHNACLSVLMFQLEGYSVIPIKFIVLHRDDSVTSFSFVMMGFTEQSSDGH